MADWSAEETDEPLIADHRNFVKVEKWSKDGKVERTLYAGSSLDKAREVFAAPPGPGRWLMQRFIDGAGRADG